MALKLYNTLTRHKDEFTPIKSKHVKMYVCGPTVYDHAHIGNLSSYIFADILRRYFDYQKYKVKHVMNITDVDDRTIKASHDQEISLTEFTQKYTEIFLNEMHKLKIVPPTKIVKATDHIKDMIKIIADLLKKKIAYRGQDGSVYFSIVKFPEYGKLNRIDKSNLKIGLRVNHQEYDKEEAADFVLWKTRTPDDGEVYWDSPFGEGRPGWHIECSAMSIKHLGETIDIHTGAVDNAFPHHENEIAQSESYTGKKFVNYWLHREHLLINGQKMSKSKHNFTTLTTIEAEKYSPRAFRYLVLTSHYRSKLNFTWESLKACQNVLKNIDKFIVRLGNVKKEMPNIPANSYDSLFNSIENQFFDAVEDDLNTPKGIAVIHNFIKKINILLDQDKIGKKAASRTIDLFKKFDEILGVLFTIETKIPKKLEKLAAERELARKNADYKLADQIRQEITKSGFIIEDTPYGPQLTKN